MRHAVLIGALCTVCLTACSEDTGPNISGVPSLDITRVDVFPKLDTLFVADTLRATDVLQMQADVISRLGTPIAGAKVAWATSAPEVAIVTEAGLVIPTGYGTTVISASASSVGKATIVVMPAARMVVVTPGSDTIFVEDPMAIRDSVRLRATAYDEAGKAITGVAFTWTTTLATTATVNAAGSVSARGLGVVNITARSGEQTGIASVRVASAVKSIQAASPVPMALAKDTVQLTATALGYDDKPMAGRTFTWTSSNSTIATVDNNGRAIFLTAGTVSFTAKSAFTTNNVTVTALPRQFQSVSSGADFTCGFTNLGRGYCWGVGDAGQLASAADSSCFGENGARHDCTLAPKRFSGPAIELTAISAGDLSACAISKDRLVYCWGSDESGRIGNGLGGGGAQPRVATVAQERFDSITVGGRHACALTTARLAYCWGNDSFGQLGDNRVVNSSTPIPVSGGLTFSALTAGGNHTCGISAGQAYCWGDNSFGQLGIGSTGAHSQVPVLVAAGQAFVAISAGDRHTCALTSNGDAFCWGENDFLQAGASIGTAMVVPTAVGGGSFSRISAGFRHTCAMTGGGSVSCWGSNDSGQLGTGAVGGTNAMSAVVGSVPFKSITAGTNQSCGLGTDGETYCWGSNVLGGLGNELQAAFRTSPQKVAVPR